MVGVNEQEVRDIVRSVLIETYPPHGMASLVRSGPPALETIVREIVRAEMSGIRRDREARAEAAEHIVHTFEDRLLKRAHVDDVQALEDRVKALESGRPPARPNVTVEQVARAYIDETGKQPSVNGLIAVMDLMEGK